MTNKQEAKIDALESRANILQPFRSMTHLREMGQGRYETGRGGERSLCRRVSETWSRLKRPRSPPPIPLAPPLPSPPCTEGAERGRAAANASHRGTHVHDRGPR
ncbi:hypothetical protein KGM_206142 [Danaus plexippus plexippus]|uniref:Uncharacterized protein n=1 Tax=Danaus plexippus plexippus TaxID=278856 RepID=A0A212EGK8_DANPL|nr:hypothetical protein KGM_206142 [Danaus plexippus plexippus]